jgi:hypothetical protein
MPDTSPSKDVRDTGNALTIGLVMAGVVAVLIVAGSRLFRF